MKMRIACATTCGLLAGIGIGAMRERAREQGGEFRVINARPGTIVEVSIPAVISSPREMLVSA